MQDNQEFGIADLLYYWRVITKRWKLIGVFVVVVTGLAIVWSFTLPKLYTATATIMPIGTSSGGFASAIGQSGLGALLGVVGGGEVAPGQQLMVLLRSRSLAEQIIKKNNLLPVLFPKAPEQTLSVDEKTAGFLQGHMKFIEDKKNGNLITVSAQFEDPKLAADVVNLYVDGLQEFINENSLTASKRNRIFIGKRLDENKRDLLEAGKGLSDFYNGGKVSSIGSYVNVPFVGNDSTDQESGIKEKLKKELELLQGQKMEIESMQQQYPKEGNSPIDSSKEVDDKSLVKNVPQQVYLQYLTLRRGLLVQINTLLTQQYEMSKINEMKDELAFQVIDSARTPDTRSSPNRKKMVMFAFMISSFFSVFGAIAFDYLIKLKKTYQSEKILRS